MDKLHRFFIFFLCSLGISFFFSPEIKAQQIGEIYKDEAGVWRNAPPTALKGKKGVDGVWRDTVTIPTHDDLVSGLSSGFISGGNYVGMMIWGDRLRSLNQQVLDNENRQRIKELDVQKKSAAPVLTNINEYERFDPETYKSEPTEWEHFDPDFPSSKLNN